MNDNNDDIIYDRSIPGSGGHHPLDGMKQYNNNNHNHNHNNHNNHDDYDDGDEIESTPNDEEDEDDGGNNDNNMNDHHHHHIPPPHPNSNVEMAVNDIENDNHNENNNNTNNNKKTKEEKSNCFYFTAGGLVILVGAIIIIIFLIVVKEDDDNNNNNNNINSNSINNNNDNNDATSSQTSPTVAPTMLDTLLDPQERLNVILLSIETHPIVNDEWNGILPTNANDLPTNVDLLNYNNNDDNIDPIIRAAAWSVHTDPYKATREITTRFALASIYTSTKGYDWFSSDQWFTETSVCNNWEGIRCCNNFHFNVNPIHCSDKEIYNVIELDLSENNLQGIIPLGLGLLTDLEILWLNGNSLSGPINELLFGQQLSNLDALYLHRNFLSGNITSQLRNDNPSLDVLYTHSNNFIGVWPLNFCNICQDENVCDHPPISYTLDCRQMTCPGACCLRGDPLGHCYDETKDSDLN